jgi:hypothetical protein
MVCMIFIVHTISRIQMQLNMTSPAAYEHASDKSRRPDKGAQDASTPSLERMARSALP